MKDNEGSLLSTNNSREAGIWLADVLKRHEGDQRLIAPVENSEEMLDMHLDVKEGLLLPLPAQSHKLDSIKLIWNRLIMSIQLV